jgi:hypothetical protein
MVALNTIRILSDCVIMTAILCLLFYAILVVIPEDTKALKECNERILCQKGMLKGLICEPYRMTDYANITLNITI